MVWQSSLTPLTRTSTCLLLGVKQAILSLCTHPLSPRLLSQAPPQGQVHQSMTAANTPPTLKEAPHPAVLWLNNHLHLPFNSILFILILQRLATITTIIAVLISMPLRSSPPPLSIRTSLACHSPVHLSALLVLARDQTWTLMMGDKVFRPPHLGPVHRSHPCLKIRVRRS